MKLARSAIFLAVCAAIFTLATPALADSPTQSAYGCQGCNVITHDGPDLPFTGLNLGLLVLFGVLLVGTGLAVRHSARSGSD